MQDYQLPKKSALVTGATGFLGGHLVKRLLAMGWEVRGLGRNQQAAVPLQHLGMTFLPGDLNDEAYVMQACAGQDYVFHCAALSSPWGKQADFFNSNVLATRHVIKASLAHKAQRLVHISTPSVYFDYRERLLIKESDPLPIKPANLYAATKLEAEASIIRACREDALPAVIIRPKAIFGEEDQTLFPRLLRANNQGGVPLLGGGNALIDATYVGNVVDAMLLATAPNQAIIGEAFHISNGEPTRFQDLLQQLFVILDEDLKLRPVNQRIAMLAARALEGLHTVLPQLGEPLLTRYSIGSIGISQTLDLSKARTVLGYEPTVSLQEGLQLFASWWKRQSLSSST